MANFSLVSSSNKVLSTTPTLPQPQASPSARIEPARQIPSRVSPKPPTQSVDALSLPRMEQDMGQVGSSMAQSGLKPSSIPLSAADTRIGRY